MMMKKKKKVGGWGVGEPEGDGALLIHRTFCLAFACIPGSSRIAKRLRNPKGVGAPERDGALVHPRSPPLALAVLELRFRMQGCVCERERDCVYVSEQVSVCVSVCVRVCVCECVSV